MRFFKILRIIFFSGILLFSIFIYLIAFSPSARKAVQNIENSKLVELNMSIEEVIEIMGEPDATWNCNGNYDNCKGFHYSPPYFALDGVDILMDTAENKVKRIETLD